MGVPERIDQDDLCPARAALVKNAPAPLLPVHLVARRSGVDRSRAPPDDARAINIRRDQSGITIESEYNETVKLPFYTRIIKFRPHAEGPI